MILTSSNEVHPNGVTRPTIPHRLAQGRLRGLGRTDPTNICSSASVAERCRAEPETTRQEIRLEDQLQDELHGLLHHPVTHRRNFPDRGGPTVDGYQQIIGAAPASALRAETEADMSTRPAGSALLHYYSETTGDDLVDSGIDAVRPPVRTWRLAPMSR